MKARDVEGALSLLFNPLFLGERLTLWTMPIAARAVDGLFVVTGCALLEVPTESFGTTLGNIGQNSSLPTAQDRARLELFSVSPNDVRDVKASGPKRARHSFLQAALRQKVERTWSLSNNLLGHASVTGGASQRCVSQKGPDDVHIGALLK